MKILKIKISRFLSAQTILEYVVAMLIILDGNSVYRHGVNQNYHLAFLSGIAALCLLLVIRKGKIIIKDILWAAILEAWVAVYFVFSFRTLDIENYVSLFILGLPVIFLLSSMYQKRKEPFRLLYRIETILLFLAVASVILWLFGSILKILPHTSSIYLNWGRNKIVNGYFGLCYETALDTTFGIKAYRNSGIFTEAPMHNLWLCLALGIELFLKEKTDLKKAMVFVVTILTTLSSTGLLVAGLCFLLKYWQLLKQMSKYMKIAMGVIFAAAIPMALYYAVRLMQVKSTTVSFLMRLQDYTAGFKVWMKYPIFGSGFGNLNSLYGYSYATMHNLNDRGYSNSIMGLLGTGGLWFSLLYILGFWGMLRKETIAGYRTRAFGICYLALFVLTIFFARFMSVLFLSIGLSLLLHPNGDIRS